MSALKQYVGVEVLSQAWAVDEKTIYGWAARKQNPLPRIKLGRSVRFEPAAAQDWLDAQQGRDA